MAFLWLLSCFALVGAAHGKCWDLGSADLENLGRRPKPLIITRQLGALSPVTGEPLGFTLFLMRLEAAAGEGSFRTLSPGPLQQERERYAGPAEVGGSMHACRQDRR